MQRRSPGPIGGLDPQASRRAVAAAGSDFALSGPIWQQAHRNQYSSCVRRARILLEHTMQLERGLASRKPLRQATKSHRTNCIPRQVEAAGCINSRLQRGGGMNANTIGSQHYFLVPGVEYGQVQSLRRSLAIVSPNLLGPCFLQSTLHIHGRTSFPNKLSPRQLYVPAVR